MKVKNEEIEGESQAQNLQSKIKNGVPGMLDLPR